MVNGKQGDSILPTLFEEGDRVTVSGITKGKGFQGVVKRHGFREDRARTGRSTRSARRDPLEAAGAPADVSQKACGCRAEWEQIALQ